MAKDLFSVPIFFIIFRETIEAAIIVSVLLSFVEQLMTTGTLSPDSAIRSTTENPDDNGETSITSEHEKDDAKARHNLIKRMRIQIWAGTLAGFIIALAIGGAFIAVFYTKVKDLWADTEQIWEGVFSLIACIIIYMMGIAFLKMDRSRIKWRLKLSAAFEKSHSKAMAAENAAEAREKRPRWWKKEEGSGGKWALFLLPFITVIREGLEAVVFVGGVSLNLPASSIPIPVVVGLLCGGIVGWLIYKTGSTTTLHWFLVGSTTFLFLIGAGLASKGVGYFEYYTFAKGVGGDVAETGDGPGSYRTAGNVWHLTYGNPETGSPTTNGGWQIFNAIFGWNNTATLGSILSYVFYWIVIILTLIYLKWEEGRVSFCGLKSSAGKERAAGVPAGSLRGSAPSDGPHSGYEIEKKNSGSEGTETPADEKRVPVLNVD